MKKMRLECGKRRNKREYYTATYSSNFVFFFPVSPSTFFSTALISASAFVVDTAAYIFDLSKD